MNGKMVGNGKTGTGRGYPSKGAVRGPSGPNADNDGKTGTGRPAPTKGAVRGPRY